MEMSRCVVQPNVSKIDQTCTLNTSTMHLDKSYYIPCNFVGGSSRITFKLASKFNI